MDLTTRMVKFVAALKQTQRATREGLPAIDSAELQFLVDNQVVSTKFEKGVIWYRVNP